MTYELAEMYEPFLRPARSQRWWASEGAGDNDGYHWNATRLPRTGCDVLDLHKKPYAVQAGRE